MRSYAERGSKWFSAGDGGNAGKKSRGEHEGGGEKEVGFRLGYDRAKGENLLPFRRTRLHAGRNSSS